MTKISSGSDIPTQKGPGYNPELLIVLRIRLKSSDQDEAVVVGLNQRKRKGVDRLGVKPGNTSGSKDIVDSGDAIKSKRGALSKKIIRK